MFDDPKKELKELEGQLLAAEMNHEAAELNQEEFEELYDEILEEFGPKAKPDGTAAATAEPPIRNFANGYGKNVQSVPLGTGGEILPDDQPQPKQKSVKGLVITACLECIAIAALVVFWYFHFL